MHKSRSTRHDFPRTALVAAAILAGAALAWTLVGVPALVKYPTDLDVSPRYEGTFQVLVDPATAAPLDDPIELPLTVDRRIRSVPDESGSSEVLVRETIHQQAGDLIDVTQENAYVMDRSTVENVEDDRAYAFDESNVVDRSGAYRLNLPFDADGDDTYEVYKNEIDDTYTLIGDTETPTSDIEGLELTNFTARVEEAPLSEAYLAELNEVVPLPESLTLDELKPQLLDQGIDVDAVVAALTPALTSDDAATLAAFAAEPIPLDYVMAFDGRVALEPVTGAEVQVAVTETVGARPRLTSLPALQEVLGHYPDVPEAVDALAGLDALASGPATPLFTYSYEQTPASVADIADEARSMREQVLLAKVWLPAGLAAAAVLALAVGTVVYLRRRPRSLDGARTAEPAAEPPPPTNTRPVPKEGTPA